MKSNRGGECRGCFLLLWAVSTAKKAAPKKRGGECANYLRGSAEKSGAAGREVCQKKS